MGLPEVAGLYLPLVVIITVHLSRQPTALLLLPDLVLLHFYHDVELLPLLLDLQLLTLVVVRLDLLELDFLELLQFGQG